MNIEWNDIEKAAKGMFSVWVGHPELAWAKRAWAALEAENLTSYQYEVDRHVVLLRLMVLGAVYADFCDVAWDEFSDVSYPEWARLLDLQPFIVGQIYGRQADVEDAEDESEALDALVEKERPRVVEALLKRFDGVNGLYHSLWTSRLGGGVSELDDAFEVSDEQFQAFSWVDQGCMKYRF